MNDRRPRRPPDYRATAEGAARAVESALPADDHGLGSVGEKAIADMLDEADRDEAAHRTLVRFTPRWRAFIRRQDETRLEALDELIDDRLERRVLNRMWKRAWQITILVAPLVYGYVTGFFEKVWPTLRRIIDVLKAPPT